MQYAVCILYMPILYIMGFCICPKCLLFFLVISFYVEWFSSYQSSLLLAFTEESKYLFYRSLQRCILSMWLLSIKINSFCSHFSNNNLFIFLIFCGLIRVHVTIPEIITFSTKCSEHLSPIFIIFSAISLSDALLFFKILLIPTWIMTISGLSYSSVGFWKTVL